MNSEQLADLKAKLKISADKIIREEAEMVFLDEFASDKLSQKAMFYGGTALRLAYDSPRFSEDIDLIEYKKINFSEFAGLIKKISARLGWKLSDIKEKRQTFFALFLIKDENLKHPFSLKIELHKPAAKIKIKPNLSLIKSPVSILSPLLLIPSLEDLKKMKEDAIANRRKARDIFDLWYIAQVLRINFSLPLQTPKFKKLEFKNELQVFLPPKYYPIINELYEKINAAGKNK